MATLHLPDFLIIGAAKSGTTSLYEYLGQHPQVYKSPIKEPRFFAYGESTQQFNGPGDSSIGYISHLADYQRLFAEATPTQIIGEASPIYLYSGRARERIRQYVPDVKLIAILRHPADRAFSHFLDRVREGTETPLDFSAALKAEPERKSHNWYPHWLYRERGYYYRQLAAYYAVFPAEQIRVFLYDDLQTAPLALMQSIFRFLEVDDRFCPDLAQKYNEGGYWLKNRRTWTWLRTSRLKNIVKASLPSALYQNLKQRVFSQMVVKARLSTELRAEMTADYREDILHLQELIGRDLSHWRK
jgi:hypothetical protein